MHKSNDQAKPNTLKVNALRCVRGERTLFTDLSFNLDPRQCLHVIGANGSGKTSLLRIITGISEAESGQLNWADKSIKNNLEYFAKSAYIGHKDGLKNELTAVENLTFYQQLEGIHDIDKVDDHLVAMNILECADLTANKLSFGQRRRLAFARLLSGAFKLWILDEPFTGIDHQGRKLIEDICVQHLSAGGMIILTNHRSLAHSQLAEYLIELNLQQFIPSNAAVA